MRALIAIRLSNVTDNTTSPVRQRKSATSWCAQRGATIVGEAVDLDVSATKTTPFERPQLGEWLNNRADEFDVIVWWRQDRAVRSMADMSELAKWARQHGKLLVFCEGPTGGAFEIDMRTASPITELMLTLFAFASQMEATAIKERVLSSRSHLRSEGRWHGGRVPFGYRVVENPEGQGFVLEIDPDPAAIIREAAQRIIEGETMYAISADFDARGIATPLGRKAWSSAHLSSILRGEHLRGFTLHQGRPVLGVDGHPRRDREPVLDDDEWAALQAAMDKRKRGEPMMRTGGALLVRVLYCAGTNRDGTVCGRPMYGSNRRSPHTNELTRTYRCTQRGTGHSVQVKADVVDKWAAAEFLKRFGGMPMTRRVDDPGEDHSGEIERTRESIARLRADRAAGLYDGSEDEAEYARMMRSLIAERRSLEALPNRPAGVRWEPTGQTLRDMWAGADHDGRRRLLLDSGVRITVTSGKHSGSRFDYGRLQFGRDQESEHADVLASIADIAAEDV